MENPGFDPGASTLLTSHSTDWASPPYTFDSHERHRQPFQPPGHLWSSWLWRPPYTRKVLSSILSRCIFLYKVFF